MELTIPEQIKIWDKCVQEYGFIPDGPHPELAARASGLPTRLRRALDAGCGRGQHSAWLAQQGWRATALDWAPAAVSHTAKLTTELDLRVQVVKGDLRNSGLQAGAFHLVVCTNTLHHGRLREVRRGLHEIKRLLAIGGVAVISVPGTANAPRTPLGTWVEENTIVLGGGMEAGIPHHFFSRDELEHEVRIFRNYRIERVIEPYPPGTGPLYEGHENEWWWLTLKG